MELLQREYWDRAAGDKNFQHPLRISWLNAHLVGSRILDCGCGYGRLLAELAQHGTEPIGTDFSMGMLRQCKVRYPGRNFHLVQNDGKTLPFRDRSFDAILLFTVLTCMPFDTEQRGLFDEVRRVLCPGGLVYMSDLLLNADSRNVGRYRRFAEQFGRYGVFQLEEGVILRHHREDWIQSLTDGFECLEYERFTVTTMNGNASAAFQYLGRLC